MSSHAANDLKRILLGSAIGAAIGLVLLALGVALLWNAADQRLGDAPAAVKATPAPAVAEQHEAAASPAPYPSVTPGAATPPAAVSVEPSLPAATSIWRSIFDDEEERAAAPPAPAAAPPPASRPATPRTSTPRRPPEAQRQEDSLFF